jgi:hypothetical protein
MVKTEGCQFWGDNAGKTDSFAAILVSAQVYFFLHGEFQEYSPSCNKSNVYIQKIQNTNIIYVCIL